MCGGKGGGVNVLGPVVIASVQCCYAVDLGSIPGPGGDDGLCLHKPQPNPTEGVKTSTSPMLEDM